MTTTSFFLSTVLQHSPARRTRIYTCSNNFGDCAYNNSKKSRSSILQPLVPTPLGAPLRLAAQRVATASPHTPTPTQSPPTTQQETHPSPRMLTLTTSWTTPVQLHLPPQHQGVPPPPPCEPQYFSPFLVGPRVSSPYLGLPPQSPCRLSSGPNS